MNHTWAVYKDTYWLCGNCGEPSNITAADLAAGVVAYQCECSRWNVIPLDRIAEYNDNLSQFTQRIDSEGLWLE